MVSCQCVRLCPRKADVWSNEEPHTSQQNGWLSGWLCTRKLDFSTKEYPKLWQISSHQFVLTYAQVMFVEKILPQILQWHGLSPACVCTCCLKLSS